MAVSEIISLIDLLRNLVDKKSDFDKEFFEQFVLPTWNTFEVIHQDYKVTLKEYTRLVSDENYQIDLLAEKVKNDIIYTQDLRSQLFRLLVYLPDAILKTREQYLSDFAESIINYFFPFGIGIMRSKSDGKHSEIKPILNEYRYHPIDNFIRLSFFEFLSLNKGAIDRKEAKDILGKLSLNIQKRYDKVANAYYCLRKELLT